MIPTTTLTSEALPGAADRAAVPSVGVRVGRLVGAAACVGAALGEAVVTITTCLISKLLPG
jgi:hypothetical protein